MISLNGCAVGETPLFAAILEANEMSEVLFESWEPSDSEQFVRDHFPPFVEETLEPREPEPPEQSDEPEYLGAAVILLKDRPLKSA